jgi:hypothetical protein
LSWQSWPPRATALPVKAEQAWPISVAGGQIATSATPASPRSTPARRAAISPRSALRPFIFQFPATSGRTSGVIFASLFCGR